jgi:hypothetical protein
MHINGPMRSIGYLAQLHEYLTAVTADVDRRVPHNSALSIDPAKGAFRLQAGARRQARDCRREMEDSGENVQLKAYQMVLRIYWPSATLEKEAWEAAVLPR